MEQEEIGKFIASCRKEQGFTQAVLAEKLGITDRAVSKWETGRSLPDAAIMPELCDLLKINLSELFSGERIAMENYKETSDALLLEMKKQEESSNKQILHLEKLLITMTIVVSLTMIFVGCYLMKAHLALGIALLAFGAAIVFFTCFVGVKIEHDTGYYECPVCKKRYVPTMKAVVMALHNGTSRKMKCPYGEGGILNDCRTEKTDPQNAYRLLRLYADL